MPASTTWSSPRPSASSAGRWGAARMIIRDSAIWGCRFAPPMSRWLLSLLCILALLPASAAELTRKQLTDEYVAAVDVAYPTATITVVAPLQVKVKGAAGGEGTAFLDT